MPLVFVNGSAPDYFGYIFSTISELIDALEQNLVNAGWTMVEKSGDGPTLFMQGNSNNNHKCYVEFKVSVNPDVTNGYYLDQRGFLEVGRSNGTPINVLRHTFINGKPNRMWLTCDNDSGCLCILDATNVCRGAHFGFLNRLDQNDPFAWMMGWIHVDGYQYSWVAKSGHDSTIWRLLSDDYYLYTNKTSTGSSDQSVFPFSTHDFLQRGGWISYSEMWGSGSNVFYNSRYGRLNTTGRPVIDPYLYHEGRGSTSNYSSSRPSLYFRGFVKHAYCGVASLNAAAQVIDPDGNRIMSVGGVSAWQGMRIA